MALAADADPRQAGDSSLADGVSCDEEGCVTPLADGRFVALTLRPDALADDCRHAVVLVTAKQAPPACGSTVIDLERLRRQGAIALWQVKGGFVVEAVKPRGVNRPWAPGAAGEAETEPANLAPRPVAPRAVDATPAEADLQAED